MSTTSKNDLHLEELTISIAMDNTELLITNVNIPPASSCNGRYSPPIDQLLTGTDSLVLGYKGCPKGDPCKYAHPKICRSSLLSHKCDRVIYHATGTVTPNLYQDLPRNTVSKRPVSDPNPLMHIRLHPCHHVTPQQLTSRNLSRHLLNHIMLYQVRPLISHLFFRSNEGPEVPDVTDATNPKLSAKEHYESSVSPLTSPESKPISSTTVLNEACPNPFSMFQFLFMNIDHLISKTKQKLKFMADLCDANTLFLCFL